MRNAKLPLHFTKPSQPVPTIEVDRDSIDALGKGLGYTDIVTPFLLDYSNRTRKTVSIYSFYTPSVNFGKIGSSVFLGVANDQKLLFGLCNALKSTGAQARISDFIDTKEATRDFHLEHGLVWVNNGDCEWESVSIKNAEVPKSRVSTRIGIQVDEGDKQSRILEGSAKQQRVKPPALASRFRVARSDASIKSLTSNVESVFGLPAGSVKIVGPTGKSLKPDSTVGNLRDVWE